MKNQKNPPPTYFCMLPGGDHPACATIEKPFENATVLYGISRHEVEHCLTDRIVHDLRIAPDNPFCGCKMDGMLFSVEGYDDDPRELFQIPEFRNFVRKLSKHRIPWLYLTCLETRWLQVIALCLASNAAAITDTKRGRTRMAFAGPGLCDFLLSQIDPFMAICETLGVSQEVAETRIRAICKSFGINNPE